MAYKRKTFRECLLEGGVKGKYFSTSGYSMFRNYRYSAIKIVDIRHRGGSVDVRFQLPDGNMESYDFELAYQLKEATPQQIQSFREKESQLAKKLTRKRTRTQDDSYYRGDTIVGEIAEPEYDIQVQDIPSP